MKLFLTFLYPRICLKTKSFPSLSIDETIDSGCVVLLAIYISIFWIAILLDWDCFIALVVLGKFVLVKLIWFEVKPSQSKPIHNSKDQWLSDWGRISYSITCVRFAISIINLTTICCTRMKSSTVHCTTANDFASWSLPIIIRFSLNPKHVASWTYHVNIRFWEFCLLN